MLNFHSFFLFVFVLFLSNVLPSCVGKSGSFYDLSAQDIEGHEINFDSFRGKAVLVVNVASECGFTDDHYTQLQRMYQVLGQTDHFIILAFPCNQFGAQEPGTNKEIQVMILRRLV
jgi:glutathione peroxidase